MEIDSELRSKETWLVSEDGLWDISIGLVLLGWGLTTSLQHPIWLIGAIMLGYFLVVMTGKEVVTRPRMQYFTVNDDRLIKLSVLIRVFLAVVIIGLIIGAINSLAPGAATSMNQVTDIGVNLIYLFLSLVLMIFGYLAQDGFRFYLYGGITFLTFLIIQFIEITSQALVFSAAMLFATIGIIYLVRFVLKYPKSKTQENVHY